MNTTTTPKLKKIDGVYHVKVIASGTVHGKTKTKYVSTGCDNKAEAERVVRQSSVQDLQTAAKAGRLTQKVIGQIVTGRHLTCQKALEEYEKHMSVSRSVHTVSSNILVISNWMREARVETLPPSAVTAKHIANWINSPKLEWAAATRRTALGSVRAFFEYCASHGWIVSDPSRQVELDYSVLSHEQKEKVEKEPFTDEELKTIVKELKRDWGLAQAGKETTLFRDSKDVLFWLVAVSIGKETGFRISDVANLEWRSFKEPGKLVVWTQKTGQRVEHKLSESVTNLIGDIPVADPDYVFPEQREIIRNPKLRATLSMQFNRLCERLDIKGKSFHSIRHYKATNEFAKLDKETLAKKLAESLSMEQIATLLGHANKKTSKGYVHEK